MQVALADDQSKIEEFWVLAQKLALTIKQGIALNWHHQSY